jgi:cytidylate kinase
VGAQEIADRVSERLKLPVFDRAIVEHIAADAHLREQTVAQFDERYPGLSNELMAFLFGEKSFVKNDYSRRLFKTVMALAGMESCILVGRGTHLILPREKVLAVRIICSTSYRIARVAELIGIPIEAAQKELHRFDKEQRAFFKKVFNCRDASPYEFDLVINRDQVPDPDWAAGIVSRAFAYKFGVPESVPNPKVVAEAS